MIRKFKKAQVFFFIYIVKESHLSYYFWFRVGIILYICCFYIKVCCFL